MEKTVAHSTWTKAMALAPRIGLERTSITKDLGEGAPSAFTEDANSSMLADETSKDSRDRSSLQRIVNSSIMDIEQRSTDTERRKRLDDLFRRSNRASDKEDKMDDNQRNYASRNRILDCRAGKQWQVYPISSRHTPMTMIVEEKDFTVDNDVLRSKSMNTETRHSFQR